MTVNESQLSSLGTTQDSRGIDRAHPAGKPDASPAKNISSSSGDDDVHLSELVRSLRALVSGSPERQAQIEHLARSYASNSYRVNPEATASGIINDALAG